VSVERPPVSPASSSFLKLEQLSKRFGSAAAVEDLTLSIDSGEILALLGPSGSGKTTTLRLLAGFESPDRGRVLLEGQDMTRVTPVQRRFGMVFQHYALFPHLDVAGNVAFGLRSRHLRGKPLAQRVGEALRLVDLDGFEERRVSQLSGGQQQRVALARALAPEPRVLLLDEPLSNLDPSLRERTRRELRAMIHRIGITTVLVTHEQEEAFDLGDRVALLSGGRLEQVGTPDELYGTPRTPFVAGFVGRSCTLDAIVRRRDDHGIAIEVEGIPWTLAPYPQEAWESVSTDRAILVVRPEGVRFVESGPGALAGTITERRFTGALTLYTMKTEGGHTVEISAHPEAAAVGDRMTVALTGKGAHVFPRASA
jgi:ABC-type Fe3+/spermidine/putrescine transport system ATPase subunit